MFEGFWNYGGISFRERVTSLLENYLKKHEKADMAQTEYKWACDSGDWSEIKDADKERLKNTRPLGGGKGRIVASWLLSKLGEPKFFEGKSVILDPGDVSTPGPSSLPPTQIHFVE